MRQRSVLYLLAISLTLLPGRAVQAQGTLGVSDAQVDYRFGEYLNFSAVLDLPGGVQEVKIEFQSLPLTDTLVIPVTLEEGNRAEAKYELSDSRTLRAYSRISYWYLALLEDGQSMESQRFEFTYEDNRFDNWQTAGEPPFRAHWYKGDLAFGRGVLDTAEIAVEHIQAILPLSAPSDLDIYVYDDPADLQYALRLTGPDWVAGHAAPDLGVILVSIVPGPEERFEMERQIPHELAHVMLYETFTDGYANIPAWLNEGLASVSELYPNPDYRQILETASRSGNLLPFASLCDGFPSEASGASLAYAQSASFIYYLNDLQGASGLFELVSSYADGRGCDNGTVAVYSETLTGLEAAWAEETFPTPISLGPIEGVLPWYFLAFVILLAPLVFILFSLIRRKAGKA